MTVLPGVTIGNNCVIGANNLITKDIPDNSRCWFSSKKLYVKLLRRIEAAGLKGFWVSPGRLGRVALGDCLTIYLMLRGVAL